MSDIQNGLLAIRELLDEMIAASGGAPVPVTGGLDDPLTAPLSVEALWVPPLLARLVAATKRKYPDGYTEPKPDITGRVFRHPVVYPRGLVFQKCLERKDLTESQREMLLYARPYVWALGLVDGGSDLSHHQLDHPFVGGFITGLSVVYDERPERLERDLRRWFWTRWQVEVDGDRGGL